MSIVVAGAGTAGWMVALYVKKRYPLAKVTVIYDDKIPIIGVGEGTTPHIREFMDIIDIEMKELVKNCDVTVKNSIKFTNWKGDGTYYHHAFYKSSFQDCDYFSSLAHGIHLDKIDAMAMLAENNKVPVFKDFLENEHENENEHGHEHEHEHEHDHRRLPLCHMHKECPNAIHFDAKKLAEYLQRVAISRGIKTMIGKIEDVTRDEDDYITEIILDTKETIKTEFVFDCTGFARFFASKIYNSPIKSYGDMLPAKRAIAFFIDKQKPTPPFTEAIAMKYGWMWKIPVGDRYGCGYVFDSDLVSDEDAYNEICEVTNQKPEIRKKLNFKPEVNTRPLHKNTLAIGLAHGFLEPLEATSLMVLCFMMSVLDKTVPWNDILNRNNRDSYAEDYNKIVTRWMDNCADMIYIHYLTPRNDTEFWKKFKDGHPESVTRILNNINSYDVNNPNFLKTKQPFDVYNFIKCMGGVDYIKQEPIERNKDFFTLEELNKQIDKIKKLCDKSKNHDDYLNVLANT